MSEITNKYIAKLFKQTAAFLELKGESSFKTRAYTNASRTIERLPEPVAELAKRAQLAQIKGVGAAIQQKIKDTLETGTFPLYERLLKEIPQGVQEIMTIKGLGPKKVKQIWHGMGITSIGELYYACNENRLAQEKGFGKKTQEKVMKAIEFYRNVKGQYHYAKLEPVAERILAALQAQFPEKRTELTGEIRRKCEVLTQVDVLMEGEAEIETWLNDSQEYVRDPEVENAIGIVEHETGIPIHLHFSQNHFINDWFQTTASAQHLQKLNPSLDQAYESEAKIYESLGFPYIIPELREGREELPKSKAGAYDNILNNSDLKGVLHAHSTYSDGAASLKQMADACREKGYEYLGITDHSKSAFYANGLSEGRVETQLKEADQLNAKYTDFRIFKGIESDILNDGSLDYEEEVLKQFDFIIASIHSQFNMSKEKATARLIKAIENPYTKILGHPTARLLLVREGYAIDHEKVIDACAANSVSLEVNANPYRLDIDWRWLDYAMGKGVKTGINPDAHSIKGIDDMRFGLAVARKGGLTKEMCLNALSKEALAEMWGLSTL